MTQGNIDQLLRAAVGHHQAGRMAEAEKIYHQILSQKRNHSDALNLLGVIAQQRGDFPASIEWISRAIASNPGISGYHFNLGVAQAARGRIDDAINSHARAVQLDPSNIGAWNDLSSAYYRRGRLAEAIIACNKVVGLMPDYAPAYSNLSLALRTSGQVDASIAAARRAVALKPDLADAHNNLGAALLQKGEFDQAISAFNEAIRLKSDFAEAYGNLSPALRGKGMLDEAIVAAKKAISHKPDFAEAHNGLGAALWNKHQFEQAIAAFKRTIEIKPDYAEAYNNLGGVLADTGALDESVAAYLKAVALKPNQGALYRNLGATYKRMGRLDEALDCWRKAISLNPNDIASASNLVFSLHYHPAYDSAAILAEYKKWAQRHEQPLAAQIRTPTNDRTAERRLKIGYVSPDFREHPAGRILLPLLANHNHEQFEIFCYSDVQLDDAVTQRLRSYAEHWRNMVRVNDVEMTEQIRRDQIDVLVDTTMHMADNRLLVFARKPAPVQLTWLGYPGTTGLQNMDYRLSDPFLDPPGQGDESYTERTIRLPHCYWCYEPLSDAPEVNALPALDNGYLTFGCFNNYAKVNPATVKLWLRVLHAVGDSRMILRCPPGSPREVVSKAFDDAGVGANRLEFVDRLPSLEYLRLHQRVDLCLDPIPYPGHTCTLDSLWMGVPPITLAGVTVASRGGASILSNAGLSEFVAHTSDEYVTIAQRCPGDIPGLAELRSGLRRRMQASPLVDGKQFAADFESAYRQIWRAWCERAG